MTSVIVAVSATVDSQEQLTPLSPVTQRMLSGLRSAIAADPDPWEVEVWPTAWFQDTQSHKIPDNSLFCPLTIELPPHLPFPGAKVFQLAQDIPRLRQWISEELNHQLFASAEQLGDLWLPIVWTAKGPLYAEVIGEGELPNSYQQPVDLSDQERQPLYRLAYRLLANLEAPPSVYLLQFSLSETGIVFDRLWPFAAAPAIASLGVQAPDLFVCHWRCLRNQPFEDILIRAQVKELAAQS
ncbi:MAG: hypothetical protein AAGG02_09215 [Cyanobacteria bacterium P01_H01_bin.15]